MSRFLAIIPARGGSKRLPRKNILELNGKALIQWTIEAAKKSKFIDSICVTSDDDEILNTTSNLRVLSIKRPDELATNTATTIDVIKHAIESISLSYDYIVLLQPTSPLRTETHIDEAIQLLNKQKADAIVSVCEMEHSPLWSNILPHDHSMVDFIDKKYLTRSQDLPTYYRLNGAIYICRTDRLLNEKTFFIKSNVFAYVMDALNSIDIDNLIDFYTAEAILQNL